MMCKTFAGFDVADFRSRWIQSVFPKCRLLASSGAECPPGVHSGCTCLDELETKLYVNILYLVCCKMCVFYVFRL